MPSKEDDLRQELRDLYWRWKDDYKYNANRFIQKLEKDGPVKTAADLVLREGTSSGFKELQTRGLLQFSVEALVLRDEFRSLFTDDIRIAAEKKLRAAGVEL